MYWMGFSLLFLSALVLSFAVRLVVSAGKRFNPHVVMLVMLDYIRKKSMQVKQLNESLESAEPPAGAGSL